MVLNEKSDFKSINRLKKTKKDKIFDVNLKEKFSKSTKENGSTQVLSGAIKKTKLINKAKSIKKSRNLKLNNYTEKLFTRTILIPLETIVKITLDTFK